MVNTDGGTGFSGGLILPGSIEWADVKSGMVVMGSADRSIYSGALVQGTRYLSDIVSKSPEFLFPRMRH